MKGRLRVATDSGGNKIDGEIVDGEELPRYPGISLSYATLV